MTAVIWKPASVVLALGLLLSGCVPTGFGGARSMALAGGAIVVEAPAGYCVDPSGSRETDQGGFVLLGGCHSSGAAAAAPVALSVTVTGQAPEGGIRAHRSEIRSFLKSPAGRAALSRSGDAKTVRILDTALEGDLYFILVEDTADPAGRLIEAQYWRAMTVAAGKMVSLAALPRAQAGVDDATQRALLATLAAGVKARAGG